MKLRSFDHVVLTVADIDRSASFYADVLNMKKQVSESGRVSLHFGTCKINLHEEGAEFQPCAARPTPGSADLCFISETPMTQLLEEMQHKGRAIIEGPLKRIGARGPMTSIYIQDPDGNLLELSCYGEGDDDSSGHGMPEK